MATSKLLQVSSESEMSRFAEHIFDPENNRLLFSAPFGAGKSTFLKEFFKDNTEYLTLKIYPVNYSVASNEDVFELIKYDLVYELLNNFSDDIYFAKEEFSMLLVSQMFILHKLKLDLPLKMLVKAASAISGTDMVVNDAIDSVVNTIGDFSTYKTEVNTNELDSLKKYVQEIKIKKGHIHENDEITELISMLLERLKESKDKNIEGVKHKTVLLIDDLDRLDPEHTFRLFNIFTAHYDEITEVNKFGFDKIIFVCDVNNIAKMFQHRYGIDFSGYIDKFYSIEIFHFSIKRYLKGVAKKILQNKNHQFKYFPNGEGVSDFLVMSNSTLFEEPVARFEYILSDMIDENIIRIRNFYRVRDFYLPNFRISLFGSRTLHVLCHPLLSMLINLQQLFPRPIDLLDAFQILYKVFKSDYSPISEKIRTNSFIPNQLINLSLPFLLDEHILENFDRATENHIFLCYNEEGQPITMLYEAKYSFDYSFYRIFLKKIIGGHVETVEEISTVVETSKPNPYWFVYKAYETILARKYLDGQNEIKQ